MAINWDKYPQFDPEDGKGFGNSKQWRGDFFTRMGVGEATVIIKSSGTKPHQILGVSALATDAEIKKAFRKLLMEWHPDRNQHRTEEAEAMTKKIIAAYTVLTQ